MSAITAVTIPAAACPADATFEKTVDQLFKDLEKMDDHEEFDLGHLAELNEGDDLEARVERTIAESEMTLLNNSVNSSRSIRDLEFTDINDSFRGGADDDLFPQVTFDSLGEMGRLNEAAVTVTANVSNTQYAPATVNLFIFAERRYFSFLQEMDSKFPDFLQYQPTPYPMKKLTLMMYLYWLKVDKNYQFSTIQSTFCYGFLAFLYKTKRDRNLRAEFTIDIKNTLRALLRKFGNDKFKVEPLMNPDLVKLRLLCDQTTDSGARLDAVLAQGRARGLRADSFEHVKLKHLTWTKIVADNKIRLCLDMEIVKDKVLLANVWRQNLLGWVNLKMCPNISLLIYLADIRGVFEQGSAAECLIKGDFTLNPGLQDEPLFTPHGKFTTWTNKSMSNAIKSLSATIDKRYSTRSMRSGLVVTCLLGNRIENNGVFDDKVADTLATFVHWKNKESLKPYDRWITQHFSSINSLQEPSERIESFRTLSQLAKDMGFLDEDVPIASIDDNAHITDVDLIQSIIYHECNSEKPKKWAPKARRLQPPNYFKDYHRSLDSDLDNEIINDDSGKDIAWLAYWKRNCLKEAETAECKILLAKDQQYINEKKRDRKVSIERVYGATSLIRKFYADEKAQLFVAQKLAEKFKKRGKLSTTLVLNEGTYKRKVGVLAKKEKDEIEAIKVKYQRLKRELDEQYKGVVEPESEEEYDIEEIVLSSDSE